jgi:hypothetical protein
MSDSSKSRNVKALKEAGKRNGLIYKKHNRGTISESVKLVDEKGDCFQLNNDLSIKKCDEDNELAAAEDMASKKKTKSASKKKTSYKIQKGLQKA